MQVLDKFTYNGKEYCKGSIIVRSGAQGNQEDREIFVRYLPEKNMYVVRPLPPSKTYGNIPRKVYYESVFMKSILYIEQPTQDAVLKAWEVENDLLGKNNTKDISNVGMFFIMILLLAIIAAFPPAALILIFYAFARKDR